MENVSPTLPTDSERWEQAFENAGEFPIWHTPSIRLLYDAYLKAEEKTKDYHPLYMRMVEYANSIQQEVSTLRTAYNELDKRYFNLLIDKDEEQNQCQ